MKKFYSILGDLYNTVHTSDDSSEKLREILFGDEHSSFETAMNKIALKVKPPEAVIPSDCNILDAYKSITGDKDKLVFNWQKVFIRDLLLIINNNKKIKNLLIKNGMKEFKSVCFKVEVDDNRLIIYEMKFSGRDFSEEVWAHFLKLFMGLIENFKLLSQIEELELQGEENGLFHE